MSDPVFFRRKGPFTAAELAEWIGARIGGAGDPARQVHDIAPLDTAQKDDLAYFENPAYLGQLSTTRAGICLLADKYADRAPKDAVLLITPEPYRCYGEIAARFYPQAMRPLGGWGEDGIQAGAFIHPRARIEDGVSVEPGAVIGADAQIGSGTCIGAGATVGVQVRIGRDCSIAAGASLSNALLGDRVIVHPGVRIGQDGFGFAMGPKGHRKIAQIGRVVVQNDVEIGANTTIDRGASRDTVIGEGSKIDNQVQIGHNVVIGRHCVIVAQTGISGSTELGDFVAIGGQAGLLGHLKIGDGAQIAASSRVRDDVPAGARWGGTPAKPMRDWFRELTAVKKLGESYRPGKTEPNDKQAGGASSGGDN